MTSAGTSLPGQQQQQQQQSHNLDSASHSISAFVEQQQSSDTTSMSVTTVYSAPYCPPAPAFNHNSNNPPPHLYRRPSQPGGVPVPSNQCTPVPPANSFGVSEQSVQTASRGNLAPPLPHSSSVPANQPPQTSIMRTNPTTPVTHTLSQPHPRISSTSTPASPIESSVQLDIVYHPVTEIVAMLAAKLQNLITTNDRLKLNSSSNLNGRPTSSSNRSETRLLSFHARNIPSITITAYLNRILKYCPTDPEVFISVLVYFDRILRIANSHAEPIFGSYYSSYIPVPSPPLVHSPASSPALDDETFTIDSFNVHRLVITTIAVATKFFSDQFYTNSRYARVPSLYPLLFHWCAHLFRSADCHWRN
jgi:PHO85 cyclin-6/7